MNATDDRTPRPRFPLPPDRLENLESQVRAVRGFQQFPPAEVPA